MKNVSRLGVSVSSTAGQQPGAGETAEQPFWNQEVLAIPLCQSLVQSYQEILLELTELTIQHKPFMTFPEYGLYSTGWEAFPLSLYEGEFSNQMNMDMKDLSREIRRHLPIMAELIEPLEQSGHLRNVFVSRLRPGAVIHPHRGWTPDFLRIHLGLMCDPGCRITVGEETHTWQPGHLLAFKDGGPYLHSVRHDGSRDRIIA